MNDILTPDQIANLVSAAERGELPATRVAPPRARRIREIDFARPTKLIPAEVRKFEQAHAAFCRAASVRFSNELRSLIKLEVINCEQVTWSGALRELAPKSIYGIASTDPPKRRSDDPVAPAGSRKTGLVVCVEQPLVFRWIERLLGGSYSDALVNRELTEIEAGLTARLFESLLVPLSAVWSDLLGLTLTLVGRPSQSVGLDLALPSDPAVMVTIEVRDDAGASTIRLLVPYASIAAATKTLTAVSFNGDEAPPENAEAIEQMRTAMAGVDVELRAEVGAVELTIDEVLALVQGDVLMLSPSGSEGMFIGDKQLNSTRAGRSGNRRAIQVIERRVSRR